MRIGEQPDTRLLPERAKLEFHYPDGDTVLYVPFYENPKITESMTANYVEYNPLARAGSLYVYTGSKSRKIKIKAFFTLPHLMEFSMGIGKFRRIFLGASKKEKKLLFSQFTNYQTQPSTVGGSSIARELQREYYAYRLEQGSPEDMGLTPAQAAAVTAQGPANESTAILQSLNPSKQAKAIHTMLFFIALFRSSVTNNAGDPLQGPPLIRLNFGTLYQSVPCIAKSYNIAWEEDAKYELETLTPRRIEVNLELHEVRIGDFGEYLPATMSKRDNLTGWESAIASPYTLDPMKLMK